MTNVSLTLTLKSDIVQSVIQTIRNSFKIGVTPMLAVAIDNADVNCEHPLAMVYVGETRQITERGAVIPLAPTFYQWQVAALLIEHGYATNEHETMRSGIRTKWFDLVDKEGRQ